MATGSQVSVFNLSEPEFTILLFMRLSIHIESCFMHGGKEKHKWFYRKYLKQMINIVYFREHL